MVVTCRGITTSTRARNARTAPRRRCPTPHGSAWPSSFFSIYGLEDVDRGADALTQAQRLGYTPGDRETTQLADGYRARADALARTARTLAGLAQEQEYLTRAASAYHQALDLYAIVTGFADVARTMRLVQKGLAQVDQRTAVLALKRDVPEQRDEGPAAADSPPPVSSGAVAPKRGMFMKRGGE